jgi:hypothetical protein
VELSEADERAILTLRERLHGERLFDEGGPYPADAVPDDVMLYLARQLAVDRAWRSGEGIPDGIEELCEARDRARDAIQMRGEEASDLTNWGIRLVHQIIRREFPSPETHYRTAPAHYHPAIARTAADFARDVNVNWHIGYTDDDFIRNRVTVRFEWYGAGQGRYEPRQFWQISLPGGLDDSRFIRRLLESARAVIPADATPDRPPMYLRSATWSFETP